MSGFQQAKIAIGHLLGLPKDALHIYVGLAVFLAAAALLRRPLGSWVPIAAVAAAALIGEAWDLIETRAAGETPHLAPQLARRLEHLLLAGRAVRPGPIYPAAEPPLLRAGPGHN